MTTQADELAKSARDLIDAQGVSVTFRRRTGQSYSAGGSVSGGSDDDETVKAVFTNFRSFEVDGGSVQRGDRKVLMSNYQTNGNTLTKEPQPEDELVGKRDTVSVVEAKPLEPSGTTAAWVLQVRE